MPVPPVHCNLEILTKKIVRKSRIGRKTLVLVSHYEILRHRCALSRGGLAAVSLGVRSGFRLEILISLKVKICFEIDLKVLIASKRIFEKTFSFIYLN